ncbi:MAG: hypothetical protein VB088_08155 [Sphaerochaeta sp.]|nr:hypothetical protein [Sphaerochaeta sp.]
MAWSWKTFGKLAAGVALIGLGTVTGGATLGAAGAVLGSLAGGAAAIGVNAAIDNQDINQERLELEKQQYQDGLKSDLNSAFSAFDSIKGNFDTLKYVEIPSLESSIGGLETNIDLWDEEFALKTGQLQQQINTVDDLLGNWQNSYDAQTRSAQSQGRSNLTSLLSNWSDAEVAAADRGMGGSMQLIAQQERAKAVEYAGSDLSLAGNDGIFGSSYASLVANLESEKAQYESKRSLLSQDLNLESTKLNNRLSDWNAQITEYNSALDRQRNNLRGYYSNLESQYKTALEKSQQLGTTDPRLAEYKKLLDEYKQYI